MMGERDVQIPPPLVAVRKPLALIPVGLKEAALDSPPWRATTVHYGEQFDAVEKWLDGYVKAAGKLAQETSVLETIVGAILTSSTPPSNLSEAVIDHDYTLLALKRYGEGAREHFDFTLNALKKTQVSIIDPIKAFLTNDIKAFKDLRKLLEATQKQYDNLASRYYSQAKTKEPSALREDAFLLHEARKTYLKCSMDFCIQASQLHAALDDLLIRVFSDQWLEMKGLRETSTHVFRKHCQEIGRIRAWSKEVQMGDRNLKHELIMTRIQIEDRAESAARPSRELDEYAASTVPYLGNRPSASQLQATADRPASRQGWLFLRTVSGKPARTNWIRRWFFVKNGVFGWMNVSAKSGGVEESDKIGVLLCSVRAAFQEERRFCFEVKTKDATLMLQAETQSDLTEWIAVFENAKQKALDDPSSTELITSSTILSSDPVFGANTAMASESAAKEGALNLTVPEEDPANGSTSRRSVDTNGRDTASRLIHKLDLHRKTTAGAQLSSTTTTPTAPSFGITSLISSSHSAMPIGLHRVDSAPLPISGTNMDSASLAPTTFVQPPAPTNLSRAAVMVGAERAFELGIVDSNGGVPNSIMANQWGTVNYGHLSRIERGEVRATSSRQVSLNIQRRLSDPTLPSEDLESLPETVSEISDLLTPTQSLMTHRKTMSEQDVSPQRRLYGGTVEYPSFYPNSLKPHDAQMRMLFPNVPNEERVVLVFRASWNPDERQDLPGRVFVTLNQLYFYSHHFGFTLVGGISLSRITDVSVSRQDDHDLLYLQIEARDEHDEASSIIVKTFLEPIKTLQRRLKFLTSNCSAEEPQSLEDALRILIHLDSPRQHNLDSESDSESSHTRVSARTRQRAGTSSTGYGLRVDRSIYGGDSAPPQDATDVLKFRLPTQPVLYAPKDMTEVAAEGIFGVSAKALFHIMFGDKSAISQMLYRERRGTSVTQYPWTAVGESRLTRNFEYEIAEMDDATETAKTVMIDSQTVEIASDHLCYVVTDLKTPWHLPHARDFSLIAKIVITHIAKSKCQLRIFTAVEWRKIPSLSKALIEKHAMDDLRLDAQDLFNLITDQVQKLGPNCYTKKAIEIFGHLGQQNEAATITVNDTSVAGRATRLAVRRRTLTALVLENAASLLSSAASTVLMSIIGSVNALLKVINAHSILGAILVLSIILNLQWSTNTAATWWYERNAIRIAQHLGIGPNVALSKSIHLSELNEVTSFSVNVNGSSGNKCASTFRSLLEDSRRSEQPLGSRSSAQRLRRTRYRMGVYRHDLMVALRVVNAIERETVQAEFEEWLFQEGGRCEKLGVLLSAAGPANDVKNASQIETEGRLRRNLGGEVREEMRDWYGEYCGSCLRERDAMIARDQRVEL